MSIRGVSAYARTQAIVRARYSTLLDDSTWSALIECRDLPAAIAVLAKTSYEPYLEIPSEQLTARRLVYQLHWRLARDYEKLHEVTPEPGRHLIASLGRTHEVDNVKAALRGVENGASWDQVRHLLAPITVGDTLLMDDLERMVRSESVPDAVEETAGSPYYDTLVHALERYRTEHNLFPLEVALDLAHRRSLWAALQRLAGRDFEEALRLIGTVLDTDNLLWALRYRLLHHLSQQEIINYTLPFGFRVEDEDIRAIAADDPVAEVVARIYEDLVDSDVLVQLAGGALGPLEQYLRERLMELCRATFSGDPFHIGLPIAYLLLCENEIRNLTTVVEGKASNMPPAVFEPLLVR